MPLANLDENATELLELIWTPKPKDPARCVYIDLTTQGGNNMLSERMRKNITKVCKEAGFNARIAHTERYR